MSLTAYSIPRFGGLNLARDTEEVGSASTIDCANVDVDRLGRLRSRDGSVTTIPLVGVTAIGGLGSYESSTGTKQLIVGYDVGGTIRYQAYTTAGVLVATALPASSLISSVRFGNPAGEYLYIANPSNTIWRWSGAAFTQPAGMPTALYIALLPRSNRLVAGFTGGGGSRVEFSNAGVPETWGVNDWVDLTPGDGSNVSAMANFGDLLFVFKRERFFVFYSTSTSGTGTPIFNYRTVNGYGAIGAAAGLEGVYFFDGRSVWLTTGGTPQRISEVVEPWIRSLVSINGTTVDQTLLFASRLEYSLGRLYLSLWTGIGVGYRSLIYDPMLGVWLWDDHQRYRITTLRSTGSDQEFHYWFTSDGVHRSDPTSSLDSGANIATNYQSGFYELSPGNKATTRWTKLWGTGSPTFGIYTDHATSDPLGRSETVTLGIDPAVSSATHNKSYKGELFSHKLSSTSGAWSVNRIQHDIAETSKP